MKENKKYVIVQPALEYNDSGYSPSFSEVFWGEYRGMINLFETQKDAELGLERLTYDTLVSSECSILELCDYNSTLEAAFVKYFEDMESDFYMDFGSEEWKELYPKIQSHFCHMQVVEMDGNKFKINIDEYFGHFKIKDGEIVAHNPKDYAIGYEDGSYKEGSYYINGQKINEKDFPEESKRYLLGDATKKLLDL